MHKQPLLAITTLLAACLTIYFGLALFFASLAIDWSTSKFALQFKNEFPRILGFGEGGYGQQFGAAALGCGLVMILLVSLAAKWTAKHPVFSGITAALGTILILALLYSGFTLQSFILFFYVLYFAFTLGPGIAIALIAGFAMRLIVKLDGLPKSLELGNPGSKIRPPIVTEDELAEDANIERQLGSQ